MKSVSVKFFLVIILVMSFSFSVPAYAVVESCPHGYRTFNDHTLNGGVGSWGAASRYFWVDTSAVNVGYSGYADWAALSWNDSWVGVPTSISLQRTYTKSQSVFDIYNIWVPSGTGIAKFYIYNTEIFDPSSQNWGWTQIYLDVEEHAFHGYSADVVRGIVAHEFGHTMGLSHQPSRQSSSVMYNYDNRAQNRAHTVDCNTINHLY